MKRLVLKQDQKIDKKKNLLNARFESEGIAEKELEKKVSDLLRFDILGTLMTLRQIAVNPGLIDPNWIENSNKNLNIYLTR